MSSEEHHDPQQQEQQELGEDYGKMLHHRFLAIKHRSKLKLLRQSNVRQYFNNILNLYTKEIYFLTKKLRWEKCGRRGCLKRLERAVTQSKKADSFTTGIFFSILHEKLVFNSFMNLFTRKISRKNKKNPL